MRKREHVAQWVAMVFVASGSQVVASESSDYRSIDFERSEVDYVVFASREQYTKLRFVGSTREQEFSQENHLRGAGPRTNNEAGGDGLRSFLTLPSVADPNFITPRPIYYSPKSFDVSFPRGLSTIDADADEYLRYTPQSYRAGPDSDIGRRPTVVRIRTVKLPRVRYPHLWASAGTILGGVAQAVASGYRLSEFRVRVNSWESERQAMREQGADMVQHFILGYGLTRYFLDNGSSPISAGLYAFTYEFIAGELMESFPQSGGISFRDVLVNFLAVGTSVIDSQFDSPLRFWAGSQTDVSVSTPNEFDPFRIRLGVAVGRVAGLELVCCVQNWKDPPLIPGDRDGPLLSSTAYFLSNR